MSTHIRIDGSFKKVIDLNKKLRVILLQMTLAASDSNMYITSAGYRALEDRVKEIDQDNLDTIISSGEERLTSIVMNALTPEQAIKTAEKCPEVFNERLFFDIEEYKALVPHLLKGVNNDNSDGVFAKMTACLGYKGLLEMAGNNKLARDYVMQEDKITAQLPKDLLGEFAVKEFLVEKVRNISDAAEQVLMAGIKSGKFKIVPGVNFGTTQDIKEEDEDDGY
jgi:hypothetical protein